jgi:hypothetical protein
MTEKKNHGPSAIIANELCYKLNIPNFENLIKDEWKHNLSWDNMLNLSRQSSMIPCQDAIKEEFLKFNDITWGELGLFPLMESNGEIHADNSCNHLDRDLLNPNLTVFAINYVVSGTGKLEYWLPSQLENGSINPKYKYSQVNWTTKENPYKSYELSLGAYLINATVPHRGSADSQRIVISMRPDITEQHCYERWQTTNWDDVVNMFKNYII